MTKKLSVYDLSVLELNDIVAGIAEGNDRLRSKMGRFTLTVGRRFNPCANYTDGMAIIEFEGIAIKQITQGEWEASYSHEVEKNGKVDYFACRGKTPLIAAMRSYVSARGKVF